MRGRMRKRKVKDILLDIKAKIERAEKGVLDEEKATNEKKDSRKKKKKTVRMKVEEMFEDLDNCGGELETLLLMEEKKRLAGRPKNRRKKLCLTYRKLGICLKSSKCNKAHHISELGVPYKPKEWLEHFNENIDRGQTPIRDLEGTNINKIINVQGKTLLSEAVSSNNYHVAHFLIMRGASPDQRDFNGLDSICYALQNHNLKLVEEMISIPERQVDLNKFIPKIRGTYLIYAVKYCNPEFVKLLLCKGSDPKSVDDRNRNGLAYAIEKNDLLTLKILIKAGAEINIFDTEKKDPLQMAFENNQIEMVRLLVKGGGAVNTRNRRGRRYMFFAADFNDINLMSILQERGVSLEEKDDLERNVVMRAYLAENFELCKKLLNACKLNILLDNQDKRGETLLHMIIRDDNVEFMKFIIENYPEINLNIRDKRGRTGLFLACASGHNEIADALLAQEVDPNMADNNKQTPLLAAIKNDHVIIVKLLFKIPQLNISWKDKLGMNAYEHAQSEYLKSEVYKYMLEQEAVIDPEIIRDYNSRKAPRF